MRRQPPAVYTSGSAGRLFTQHPQQPPAGKPVHRAFTGFREPLGHLAQQAVEQGGCRVDVGAVHDVYVYVYVDVGRRGRGREIHAIHSFSTVHLGR